MNKIKIFLVDDHEIFRDGIKSLITNEGLGDVIGEAGNGLEFITKLGDQTPDLILLDIDMPVMTGTEAANIVLKKNPNLKILTLTMFGDEKHYYEMVDAGVKGFILKTSGINELEEAINTVSKGGSFFSNEILCRIISNFRKEEPKSIEIENTKLTPREVEVLKLICKGMTNEKIAEQLNLSAQTVKGHRTNLLDKTNSNNTASLVIYAIKNRFIEV